MCLFVLHPENVSEAKRLRPAKINWALFKALNLYKRVQCRVCKFALIKPFSRRTACHPLQCQDICTAAQAQHPLIITGGMMVGPFLKTISFSLLLDTQMGNRRIVRTRLWILPRHRDIFRLVTAAKRYNNRIIVYRTKEIIGRWEDATLWWSRGGIMNTDFHTHQRCRRSGTLLLKWPWPDAIKCSWEVNRK